MKGHDPDWFKAWASAMAFHPFTVAAREIGRYNGSLAPPPRQIPRAKDETKS